MGVFMELRVVLLSLLQSPVSVLSRKPANTQNPGRYDGYVIPAIVEVQATVKNKQKTTAPTMHLEFCGFIHNCSSTHPAD